MIILKPVTMDDARFLYNLLGERDETINISHKKMPTWEEHCAFINSNPYDVWYIIHDHVGAVGMCYKTDKGEIGIFIARNSQGAGIASQVIPMLCKQGTKRNLAHINPKNEKSIKLFEKLGFKLIELTYELTN